MQIPFISRAYAQQLEFKGEHSLALQVRRNDSMPLCRMPTGLSTLLCLNEGVSSQKQAVDTSNVSFSNAVCLCCCLHWLIAGV